MSIRAHNSSKEKHVSSSYLLNKDNYTENKYKVSQGIDPNTICVIPNFPVYDVNGNIVSTPHGSPFEMRHTRVVSIDCEMVGIGEFKEESALARVSIVNSNGFCLLDAFVKPKVKVTDYRTRFSGIRPSDLENAREFDDVVKEVASIIKDRIVVGHAINHDFKALLLSHPKKDIRDTSWFYKKSFKPSLKLLAEKLLNINFQKGEHNSIHDAQVTMKLYLINEKAWEEQVNEKREARRNINRIFY